MPEPLPDLLTDAHDDDVIVEFDLDAMPTLPYPSPLSEGNGILQGATPGLPQEDNQSSEVSESERESMGDRGCDCEAVSSKLLVHHSYDAMEEAEVTLQESGPSIYFSQR